MKLVEQVASDGFDKLLVTLDDHSRSYPNEPDIQYYYAAYYWRNGNREKAYLYLNEAIARKDQCSHCSVDLYRNTLERMKKAKDRAANLFAISIGLNFENL